MHHPVALTLASLALVGVSACTTPDSPRTTPTPTTPTDTGTPTTSPTPVEPEVVEIGVDGDGTLTMPASLNAGAHVFRVSSATLATVMVIEPREGYTKEQLAADFGPHDSMEESVSAWARMTTHGHSLGGTWSEEGRPFGFALELEPGSYWFVDLGREPGEAGDDDVLDVANILTVEVGDGETEAVLPEPDAEATAREDRSWSLPDSIPAAGTLLVDNPTEASHQLVFERVPDDSDPEEWLDNTHQGGREIECPCNSPALLGEGEEFLWIYDLEAGPYVALDFSADEQGSPHYNGAGATLVELTEATS
jgi:hypothetical protein